MRTRKIYKYVSYSSIFWWEFQARKRTLAPNFDCHHWRQLVSVFLKVPHNLSFFVTISAPFQKWTRTIIASIKRTRAIWPQFLRKILSVFKRLISTRHQLNIMYRIRNCPPFPPKFKNWISKYFKQMYEMEGVSNNSILWYELGNKN